MDPPIDPPTMSDGELIQQLEADLDRLQRVIRWTFSLNPDFDDTGIIGHELSPMPDDIRRTVIKECMAAEEAESGARP